ncbi:hypothetical protein TIFTF001_029029 [Ficus carica]|uniref:Uncharacterized protein n=1 Tax=Ficus carica TaxID=3494 RepID=A0AA88J2B2_FICCA|nr:hypothetical protein TIFTF001_029029 [Ficus carica]
MLSHHFHISPSRPLKDFSYPLSPSPVNRQHRCPPRRRLTLSLILPVTPPPPSPLPHSTVAHNATIPSPSFSRRPQRRPPLFLLFPSPLSPLSPPPLPPCLPIKAVTILHQRKAM